MRGIKRWAAILLSAVLLCSAALPAAAAPAVSLSVQAQRVDSVTRDLTICPYRRDAAGVFRAQAPFVYASPVNRAAGEAEFLLEPGPAGARVTVDCLTDLDNDGVYELLSGDSGTGTEALQPDGTLSGVLRAEDAPLLGGGCRFSADVLREAGERAREARTEELSLPRTGDVPVLYLLRCDDGQQVTSLYFLLYDLVPMPCDVPWGSWYYSDVEFALDRGYLSGTGPDTFDPDGSVTRAALAQVLWTLGGSQPVELDLNLADVAPEDWYWQAVTWCCRERILVPDAAGFRPDEAVTREQLVEALWRCARYTGRDTGPLQALDAFSDQADVSPECRQPMEWAVASGILAGDGYGCLNPRDTLTRAQFARVLRLFAGLRMA